MSGDDELKALEATLKPAEPKHGVADAVRGLASKSLHVIEEIEEAAIKVEHAIEEKSIKVIHEIEEEAKEIVEVLDEEFLMIEETIQEIEEQVIKTFRAQYRYFVYAGQTAVLTASSSGMLRFLAFSSDFGEAFRPAVPQVLVKGSYFVSVGYIVGAIAESAYEVCDKPAKTIVETVAHETFFQLVASLIVPFLFIHTAVHQTANVLKRLKVHKKAPVVARWGPSAVGLACVPIMPLYIDHPCEHAVDSIFNFIVNKQPSYESASLMSQKKLLERGAMISSFCKKPE